MSRRLLAVGRVRTFSFFLLFCAFGSLLSGVDRRGEEREAEGTCVCVNFSLLLFPSFHFLESVEVEKNKIKSVFTLFFASSSPTAAIGTEK